MMLTRRQFISNALSSGVGVPLATMPSAAFSRSSAPALDGRILCDFGKGMSNFQSHAFDEKNRHIYVLQHSDKGTGGPARITRFALDSGVIPRPIDAQEPTFEFGHQTLDVEYEPAGSVKLWAAIGPKFSLGVARFNYRPFGMPTQIEKYVLFHPDVFINAHCTASISYDQRYLVARGLSRRASRYGGKNCVAVFNLQKLTQFGPGDRWDCAEEIWPMDDYPSTEKIDPQAIVSDGLTVLVLYGPLSIDLPNIIRRYSIDGRLLMEELSVELGKQDSMSLSEGLANEFEGAKYARLPPFNKPVLTIGMVQGGPTYFKRIWATPAF